MDALSIDDTAALGAALRRQREAAGVSRADLGERVDLDPSTIQRYERGFYKIYGHKRAVTIPGPVLALIATSLGATAADVLADAGLPEAALPSIPPLGKAEAAVAARIERAEEASIRIETRREVWEEFVSSLSADAKSTLLMHLSTGAMQTVPVGGRTK